MDEVTTNSTFGGLHQPQRGFDVKKGWPKCDRCEKAFVNGEVANEVSIYLGVDQKYWAEAEEKAYVFKALICESCCVLTKQMRHHEC